MKPIRCSQVAPLSLSELPTIRGCELCRRSMIGAGHKVLAPRPVPPCAYLNHPSTMGRYSAAQAGFIPDSTADGLT